MLCYCKCVMGVPLPRVWGLQFSTLQFSTPMKVSTPAPLFLLPQFSNIKNNKNSKSRRITRGRGRLLCVRGSFNKEESPYDVLGVPPSASAQQIKQAYRRLALKYHPDVNKQPNAQEKFMRIKHAYNTLLDSNSRLKYDFRNRQADASQRTKRGFQKKSGDEEEFYGLEDFLRDLQTEFQNWEASADLEEKPKSLWQELAELGEDFVEFLEKELNITDESDGEKTLDGQEKGTRNNDANSSGRGEFSFKKNAQEKKIEKSIDEIEDVLAQLKRELGL